MALLSVRNLKAGYGAIQAIEDVGFTVDEGQCVALLGPNGAGKTTIMRNIFGIDRPWGGEIELDGRSTTNLPTHEIVRRGIALVPEDRGLFTTMTVTQNLQLAAEYGGAAERRRTLAEVEEMFPHLGRRRDVEARRLSGGEQQMLAIARVLMLGPRLIALDEPSTGLGPRFVRDVMDVVARLVAGGVGVLIVEQNAREVCRVADAVHIIDHGRIGWSGSAKDLEDDSRLRASYLGVA